jgi:putative transposase
MMPVLRRTWAPCGTTPTFSIRARSHEKVSGIGALVVSPHRQQITLALALYPRLNIRGPQVLRFLRHLARHVRGPVLLVWDRGNPHKHQLVRGWLARHPRWEIVWFPPYAPDWSGATSSTVDSRTSLRTPSTRSNDTWAVSAGVWAAVRSC